jgi:hypothetical protein
MKKHKKPHQIHEHCPSVVMWQMTKQGTARPGLYCSKHAKWIKWLPQEEYEMAIDMGIPQLGTLPDKKSLIKQAIRQNE